MGPLGRGRRGSGGECGRGAAEACRRTLSRDRPRYRGSRSAGLPVLLLHLRPEPAVRRALLAQAVEARGEIGREATGLKQEAGAWLRPLRPLEASGGALQLLVAFAVIAAALLDPLHAAIAVGGLVGVVLVDAGVEARLARGLLGVFRIDCVRIDRGAGRQGRRGSRGGLLLRLLRLGGSGGRSRSGRRGAPAP